MTFEPRQNPTSDFTRSETVTNPTVVRPQLAGLGREFTPSNSAQSQEALPVRPVEAPSAIIRPQPDPQPAQIAEAPEGKLSLVTVNSFKTGALIVGSVILLAGAVVGASRLWDFGGGTKDPVSNRGILEQDLADNGLIVTEENGTDYQLSGQALVVQGDLVSTGSLKLHDGNQLATIVQGEATDARTYTLPDNDGTFCLSTNNCSFATSEDLSALQAEFEDSSSLDGGAASFDSLTVTNGITTGTLTAGSLSVSVAVSIASGGTGANTAQGAINNISGLNTNGDLLYHNGTNTVRLARGSNGQCLTSSDTTILWSSCGSGSGGTLLQGGNSFGEALTLGTNDDLGLNFEVNNNTVASFSSSGQALFKNAVDSTTAFQVQNAAGESIISADSLNGGVSVAGNTVAGHSLWIPAITPEQTWTSVTYGKGLFVAVNSSSTDAVMTSLDGITWTRRTAISKSWTSVTYGNGLFVAVAQAGPNEQVMTSPDGITWTARFAAEANSWRSVTYGNGLFVAVASSGTNRVMTSPDGISWTSRTAAEVNNWFGVTYGNGLFVAVSATGTNRVMTSPDGITWTAQTTPTTITWRAIGYGNGLFVAVGDGNSGLMTSPDGINWTAYSVPGTSGWESIAYGDGLYVAMDPTASEPIITSPDGVNWTVSDDTGNGGWSSVTYGNGSFVAVSGTGSQRAMVNAGVTSHSQALSVSGAITAAGGLTVKSYAGAYRATTSWTARSAAELNPWFGVTYGNGLFVAVADSGTNRVMTSPDGITWTARAAAEANSWRSVTYGNGLFVAVSTTGTNRVMTSPDGITWTARAAAEANSWQEVTYGNGLFVAVSSNGTNRVMTSPDGITWTARAAAEANSWLSVTYANGLFVAVSSNGTNRVMTSPNGVTWTARAAAAQSGWTTVVHGNDMFVALTPGVSNNVMTSHDGISWTLRSGASGFSQADAIVYADGQFVAVSSQSQIGVMTSPNGIAWMGLTVPETNAWRAITYGNGRFVAVSQTGNNRVMTAEAANFYPIALNVSNTGKVSIGADSSTYKLSVVDNISSGVASSIFNSITTDSSQQGVLALRLGVAASGTTSRFIQFYAAATADNNGTGVGRIRLNNSGVAYESAGADFAEYFDIVESVEPGDIIAISSSGNQKAQAGMRLLGVVSDTAGFIGNAKNEEPAANQAVVGLVGQVKTKVNTENGAIQPGDRLAVSSVPGVARKAELGEATIGIALEGFSGPDVSRILVVIDVTEVSYALQSGEGLIQNGIVQFSSINVGDLATLGQLVVAGDAEIQGTLTVSNVVIEGSLTVGGHLISAGEEPTTQVLGTDVTIQMDGNDTAGTIVITGNMTAGQVAQINFAAAFGDGAKPRVVLSPANRNAVDGQFYTDNDTTSNTSFTLFSAGGLESGKTYVLNYHVIE